MRKQIRYGVFETNSSMSNALTVMSKEEYEELLKKDEDDNWMWDAWNDEWVKASDISDDSDNPFCDYRSSFFDDEAECQIRNYTSASGDEIVIISQVKADY